MHVGKCLANMLVIYAGKGNVYHMLPPSANKAAHSGFETKRRCHQRSVTGVSVVPKMDIHQTFLKKKCTVEIQCIGNITKLDFFCVQSLMFRPAGLYSTDTSTWTPDAQILSAKQSKNVNFTELLDYNDEYGDNDEDSPLWMVLMDQSQLVMTIVGFIANMATSITLIKNGQVCGPYFLVALCLEGKHRRLTEDFIMGGLPWVFSSTWIPCLDTLASCVKNSLYSVLLQHRPISWWS